MEISKFTATLMLFLLLFFIIFSIDYFFIKKRYLKRLNKKTKSKKVKKAKKNEDIMEIVYLVNKFKLDKQKLPLKGLLIFISVINAFIISLVSVTIIVLNCHMIIKFIIGFALIIALIYAIYEILGRYLERREQNGQ